MVRPTVWLLLAIAAPLVAAEPAASTSAVMPAPAELRISAGRLPLTASFSIATREQAGDRIAAAAARLERHWSERTGFTFHRDAAPAPTLVVAAARPMGVVPQLSDDESYTLEVTPTGATLTAASETGALRGLATWEQLLSADAEGWYVPTVSIHDRPRFAWRGLLIDACRHWMPPETIKRNLDAMALMKLNVLHFHLTEDQGFRVESRKFPKLHELGSRGSYYTQDQIRELVTYAAARGIRIVPEFDVPGHATGWLVGYPELASAPGPYELKAAF